MDRRAFSAGIVTFLAAPLAARAQSAARVYRVGFLGTGQITPQNAHFFDALRAGLRDHGYVEGRNLVLELRWAAGKPDRLPALAAELLALPVDVLMVGTSTAALAAKAATRTTPIVFIGLTDPVGRGLVASLARPGGNLTGLTWDTGPEDYAKWLELAKDAVPGISRVAALWEAPVATNPVYRALRAAMDSGAQQLKLALQWFEVLRAEELAGALAAIERARVDALVWGFVSIPDRPVAEFALRHRLPSVAGWREAAAVGALMSYGTSSPDLFRRSAGYIDKILKGAKPGELPVEQPTKFELVINMRTAKALGLTIPRALMLRADEVVE